jgi:hypothetical protein
MAKPGDRIQITGGKYEGKSGKIIKVNTIRHQVELDDGIICLIDRTCIQEEELQEIPSGDLPDASASTSTDSDDSSYPPDVTRRVLLDVLARSIASMDDVFITGWEQQLRAQIMHYRHGEPAWPHPIDE